MVTWILHFWYGTLLIRLKGFSPERFLNLCSVNQIELWDLQYVEDGYQFYMTVKGYRKIRPLVRKSKVRLKILEKFGLPFFLQRNRKRKLFAAGFVSFFLLLYGMSLFVWDIEFDGNRTYTYDTLIRFLNTQDIRYGMMKRGVDCEEIESALRTEFSEITWVSARVSGTRLLIKVKENEVLSSIPPRDDSPCDIVADKSGVITRMIVRQGIPKVSVGDEVTEGQILVSGVLPITNDGDEVVDEHLVRSDADIWARTLCGYEEPIPALLRVDVETGSKRTGFFFKIMGHSSVLMLPKRQGSTWKLVMEERQAKIFENFYLPVYWGKITGKEYVTYERPYTEEEKNSLKSRINENFVEKLMEKGVQIIENNVKILESGQGEKIVGDFITEESIVRAQPISESKQEETDSIDERNGEYN